MGLKVEGLRMERSGFRIDRVMQAQRLWVYVGH